ncbi:MAG: M23 family metallopeptidase [bacterium]
MILRLFLILSCVFSISAVASAETGALQLTPLTFHIPGGPAHPVQGSDGAYHWVYEIQIINVSSLAWQLDRLTAVANGKVISELKGDELKSRTGPLSTRGGSAELGPNQAEIVWMHLKFNSKKDLPQKISHRFYIRGNGKTAEVRGAEVAVSTEDPLVLSPPLKGERWLAADGCCDSIRHVRALLPIDGKLYAAQRFAIDWEKLDSNNRIYSGDAKNPENYFCYGQEVLAVADAEVVEARDGLTNQVPGKPPESIDLSQADGNYIVLSISPGHYALYAHLKPGSVRVKTGDHVQAGQIIAQVGNTGNTSEPHLHFHVMDGPSPLASNGLPYVLKSFEVSGKAPSTQAFDKAAADGTPLAIEPTRSSGRHEDQLPLDLSLVQFPGN